MTGSIRGHLGIRNALSVVVVLASYFASITAAAGQRSLEVIDLSSTSAADEVSKARAAIAKGGAIVVMTDRGPDELKRTFGSYIPSSKAFTSTSKTPTTADSAASKSEPLTLRGVAAYVDASGIAHSVQALAPANDSEPARQGWRKHLDDWIQAEQTKALTRVGDDPTPPAKAWTLLYETTIQGTTNYGNYEQNTIEIYRLNDITTAADYYMVLTTPEVKPAWTGNCNGYDQCDWHTMSRSFSLGRHLAMVSSTMARREPLETAPSASPSGPLWRAMVLAAVWSSVQSGRSPPFRPWITVLLLLQVGTKPFR